MCLKWKRMANNTILITTYEALKLAYHRELGNETLRKYRILSKAYKAGKEIYGKHFNYFKLSHDFEVPYTTVKRILSLSKANFNTWNKIREGKITAFKAAQVLMSKDITYQDEIIELVIEKNLSTYDIKKIKINDYKDVEKVRLNQAVKEGFARKDVAYDSFKRTLDRLDVLLTMERKDFNDKHYAKLVKRLKEMTGDIKRFVEQ